ncbi:hypothetical protein C0Q70_14842 [Pomacea canaliculata]|uniref:Ankyrin repeat, SAM and basic leucine zipper domain-containing protein 1 n=2 Tax=Pomacea canaliculata TaxID=400727 RepID=A0A2T7NT70_POMCA|nr:hypothetical protein C0Q70_14842 [Pomacea canaliculata]
MSSLQNGAGSEPLCSRKPPAVLMQNGAASDPWSSRKPPAVLMEDFRMGIIQGSVQAVTKALDEGLDVNTILSTGWTGLMYAGSLGKVDIFKLLLEKGGDPNYHKNLYTVLMATCSSNCSKPGVVYDCVKMLIDRGVDVSVQDRCHMTALMCAARDGRLDVVQLLVDSGAQVEQEDSRGWTALSWAVQRNQKAVIKLLLAKGADPHKKHRDNLTAIDLADGKDDLIRMLEGRPAVETGAGDASTAAAVSSDVGATTQPSSSTGSISGIRYSELEVFLYGLDLGSLVSIFHQQQVDFTLLLTLGEEDLDKMGITQVGVRKKLMEAIAAVHKRNWESSSLVPIRLKSEVKCADAIAIVANLARQLRYIGSSVTYIADQLDKNKEFLSTSKDGSGPKQLLLHTRDGMKNAIVLQQKLDQLQAALSNELSANDFSPADLIKSKATPVSKKRYSRLFIFGLGFSSVILLVLKKDFVIETSATLIRQLPISFLQKS